MPLEMPKLFIENIFRGWKSKEKSKLISIITSKQAVIDTSVLEISASENYASFSYRCVRTHLANSGRPRLKKCYRKDEFRKIWAFSNDEG